jgi:hypothetical protein
MVVLILVPGSSIIRVMISKRMSWAGHVELVGGEERCIRGLGAEI